MRKFQTKQSPKGLRQWGRNVAAGDCNLDSAEACRRQDLSPLNASRCIQSGITTILQKSERFGLNFLRLIEETETIQDTLLNFSKLLRTQADGLVNPFARTVFSGTKRVEPLKGNRVEHVALHPASILVVGRRHRNEQLSVPDLNRIRSGRAQRNNGHKTGAITASRRHDNNRPALGHLRFIETREIADQHITPVREELQRHIGSFELFTGF